MMGSFSIRCCCRRLFASSIVTDSRAVMSLSDVITSVTGRSTSGTYFRSRLVTIPMSVPSSLVIGNPPMRYRSMRLSASRMLWVGRSVIGSTIIPLSDRFTLSTIVTCSSMEQFRWMMPIPPSRAMAIARLASVTVSIAALMIGMFRAIWGVSRVLVSTVAGRTWERWGTKRTSSKVSARREKRSAFMVRTPLLAANQRHCQPRRNC